MAELPGSLVFIDIETSTSTSYSPADLTWTTKLVAQAPAGFFLRAGHVMVRWPVKVDARQEDVVNHAGKLSAHFSELSARHIPVGIVQFPFGAPPTVNWSPDAELDGDRVERLLARARAAELRHLLIAGRGVWQPKAYHYEMPSGEHSNTFVRLANAIQRPRDAVAIATWLHRHVVDGLAVVTDSSTLTPIILALHYAMVSNGRSPGDVVNMSDYPANAFEVEHAVLPVVGAERVLALLSVTSTGATSHKIVEALRRSGTRHVLETFVRRGAVDARRVLAAPDGEVHEPWIGMAEHAATFRVGERCQLCHDPTTARVVMIDPRSFETLAVRQPDLLRPQVRAAVDARELWELLDEVDGIGVHAQPHGSTLEARGSRSLMAVRCLPDRLLVPEHYADNAAYQRFLSVVRRRTEQAIERMNEQPSDPELGATPFLPAQCDVVVVTGDDAAVQGFPDFLGALAEGMGRTPWSSDQIVALERPYHKIPEDRRETVADARAILVVTLGAVTGSTMQRLLVAVHDELPREYRGKAVVGGIVLHARPEDRREWEVLRNAYTHLDALWLTHLPLWSPFDEEAALLDLAHDEARVTPYFRDRKEYLGGQDPEWRSRVEGSEASGIDPYAIFWGMPLHERVDDGWAGYREPTLRPGSRFGHNLRATTTFAAVGAAMQHGRLSPRVRGAPSWEQFEMPAILRSYFDPPIVAAILRWLRPHEAWWGLRPEDAENVLAETWTRATEDDQKLLLPELLLAAAEGKVPPLGTEWLVDTAKQVESESVQAREGAPVWTEEELAPVRTGLGMIEQVRRDRAQAR